MFWTIFITLVGLWSLCLIDGIGGRWVHWLLVMAAVVLVNRFLSRHQAIG